MHDTGNKNRKGTNVMGMAASQARFLGLTARKNNVEYEGQQINQQRTMLSNETANYYNDLLGMSVPVPPSVADYTKTVYSFVDGALTNSISSMIAQPNGEYLISYTSNWIDDFAAVSASSSIVTRILDNTQTSANKGAISGSDISDIVRLGSDSYSYKGLSLYLKEFTAENMPESLKNAGMQAGEYYYYTEKTSGGNVTHYISKEDLEGNNAKLNYNVKQQANVSNVSSNGTAPFVYSYGTHALTAQTFSDTDEYPVKPDGLSAGRYYAYTADNETHYFSREAIELQDVHRVYTFTYNDETLKPKKYNENDLPKKQVVEVDIDGNDLQPNTTYYKFTDNEGNVRYVSEDNTNLIKDANNVVIAYDGGNGNIYNNITEITAKANINEYPKRDVVAKDIKGNELVAGQEYCTYYTTDSNNNQVANYILVSDIINNAPANFSSEFSYVYGGEKLEIYAADDEANNRIPDGYGEGDYHYGEHYFKSKFVENENYANVSDSKYSKALEIAYWIDNGKASLNNGVSQIDNFKSVENYTYNVGAKTFRVMGSQILQTELRDTDEYYKTLSDEQIEKLLAEEDKYEEILNKQYGADSQWMVRYVHNTTSNTWEPIFTKLNTLGQTIYSDNGASLSNIPMYKIGSAQKNEEIKNVKARFEQDSTGRIINVTLRPGEKDEVTYAVSTNTVTDQAKYDDAMNQYEYDKAKYDQAIQETNAKIEIIQAEDKNLELRLKQLDTEQDAIQTEMDAVQKVIEKNTESTFKTFG